MTSDRTESMPFHIDTAEVARVCSELIRFDTVNPPGNEQIAAEYVADYMAPLGFTVQFLPQGENRVTVVARHKGAGGVPGLVFNAHLDVVPVGGQEWLHPPFAGEIADGKVWGRGSGDMKGGLAAMMVAAKAVVESGVELRGDLIIAGTVGEEVNMIGAKLLCAEGTLGDVQAIIISEPTSNGVGLAERGVFWPEITTYGKTAHGSTPHLGVNAITMMAPLLQELEQLDIPFTTHPVLGPFTRSINTIQGGVKVNVVPDRCSVNIDMRTVPGQDHAQIRRQLEEFLAERGRRVPGFHGEVTTIHFDLPSVETKGDDPAVVRFVSAAARGMGREPKLIVMPFATEAAIFLPALGVPTIIFGPGDPALAHQPNEFVEIAAMVDAGRAYAEAAVAFLA